MRLGAAVLLVILLATAFPAGAASTLICSKSGEVDLEELQAVTSKYYPSSPARVSAIELACARGRGDGDRTQVRLLAIRVQFQPDSDPLSSGDGTFDYSEWDGATFDGPPHDLEYFELHMMALESYYESVSHGALDLEFTVAPAGSNEAYVLPHDMGYYHDYLEEQVWYVSQVESFIRDTFAAADTTDSIDFAEYDGYVVFHAGADWQSDVYWDSPYDLPSAHIALGEPILVNDGAHEIWGAAIMPETSSQDGLTIVLNGTLAHEVGHILGLSDLYNTSNFFPAIGYWGLMDSGGRIGMNTPWGWAYGLIPVPPCGWSLQYLGWTDPVVIAEDVEEIAVKASVLRSGGARLFKIPITSTEYFLLENRMDDIGKDNLVAIEQERGVVLGPVDPDCQDPICPVNHEYDFLLPGPGLLIYHVDDTRVIPGLLPYNRVNADRHRLGVAVEEADGIMDLGDISSFYWAGSRYDPFFADNNGTFSWDTFPSTDDNLGGKSYLSISGISNPDSIMTVSIRFDRWKDGWPIEVEDAVDKLTPRVADIDGDGEMEVVVATTTGMIYAWHADGSPVIPDCAGPFGSIAEVPGGISHAPALADLDGDGAAEVIVASDDGLLYAWHGRDDRGDGVADLVSGDFPLDIGGPASGAPLAAQFEAGRGPAIAAVSRGGYITIVDATGHHLGSSPYSFGHLVLDDVTLAAGDLDGDGADELVTTTTNRGWIAAIRSNGTPLPGWPVIVDSWLQETVGIVIGDIDLAQDGRPEVVAAGSDGVVYAWDSTGNELPGWPVDVGAEIIGRISLGDIDGDGYLETLVPTGRRSVTGIRMNGTAVENWPLGFSAGDSLRSTPSSPLVGDINSDGTTDVIIGGPGGSLFAWDGVTGEMLEGWPLSSDVSLGTPWIGDADDDGELDVLVAGSGGRILFYRMPYECSDESIVWSTEAGNAAGTGCYADSLLLGAYDETETLMALERTYCYPNPAMGSDLTVRVYLEEAAELSIEMLDVTGQVIESVEMDGVPTVNEFVWDISSVAGGLYLVHVEARVDLPTPVGEMCERERTEQRIMKVAVVR